MIWQALITAILCVWVGGGCSSTPRIREPFVPNPDQAVWVDEADVIDLVTEFVHEAQVDAHREQVQQRYAAMLRYWYGRCSRQRPDTDDGLRALNYIRKIHVDAEGSKKLWREVLKQARQPAPGQRGTPIPEDYR